VTAQSGIVTAASHWAGLHRLQYGFLGQFSVSESPFREERVRVGHSDSPVKVVRCSLLSSRSRIASEIIGSRPPMCQCSTSSWVIRIVGRVPARSSVTSSRSARAVVSSSASDESSAAGSRGKNPAAMAAARLRVCTCAGAGSMTPSSSGGLIGGPWRDLRSGTRGCSDLVPEVGACGRHADVCTQQVPNGLLLLSATQHIDDRHPARGRATGYTYSIVA
jgi:hypothetical protein